jgi:hypothetical protein
MVFIFPEAGETDTDDNGKVAQVAFPLNYLRISSQLERFTTSCRERGKRIEGHVEMNEKCIGRSHRNCTSCQNSHGSQHFLSDIISLCDAPSCRFYHALIITNTGWTAGSICFHLASTGSYMSCFFWRFT